MSLKSSLESIHQPLIDHIFVWKNPGFKISLCSELTSFFLSEAIEQRTRILASSELATTPDEKQKVEQKLKTQTLTEYEERFQTSLRLELENRKYATGRIAELKNQLSDLRFKNQLSDALWLDRTMLIKFFRHRGVLPKGRLTHFEAINFISDCLRAVQKVALEIVKVEYTAKDRATLVPRETQQVIIKLLKRLDEANRIIQSPVGIKTLNQAETEVRILIARAKNSACLPLRPIPTSPLSSDNPAQHYVGRPDDDALRLARQIRHADGTILITGYRGVGKSSFVNRVMYHVLSNQNDVPQDGLIVVPVIVNLAKVSGVQNILRLTLRAVRDSLLEPNTRQAQKVSCHNKGKLADLELPLDLEKEIEPLEEAYIRATYKVTMSRGNSVEKKAELGASFAIDPGKLVGGSIVGIELGKFLEGGIRRTKTEKINRELNLLDYDENAAEDDLARLIRSLAKPREFGKNRTSIRIKLVFIFDELDKMDMELGLKPMIEGLKNLFLQQHSVFVLVTSKSFYYTLLKDRAIEDAMLNSYFSAIVPVPLLSYNEARKLINDWIDWESCDLLKQPTQAEVTLLDQLTRVLVYKSFGNPRDIIRELRLMQEWADTTNQPYLTDSLAKSAEFQIIAAVQECIEKTAVPPQTTTSQAVATDGSVTLASERMGKDESRLEQVRRGLYILTEELINRQQLILEAREKLKAEPEPDDPPSQQTIAEQLGEVLFKLAKPSTNGKSETLPIAKLHKDNFSLLSLQDVQQLAKRLGGFLVLVHDAPNLFQGDGWGQKRALFTMNGPDEIRVSNDFYSLTGRQATSRLEESPTASPQKTEDELIASALLFAGQKGWAAQSSAINIIKQLGPSKTPAELKKFLWTIIQTDTDPTHRLAAAERISSAELFEKADLDLMELVKKETDERVLAIYIRLLGNATDEVTRKQSSDALIALLMREKESQYFRVLNDATSVAALTVLQTVADKDAIKPLLQWFCVVGLGSQLVRSTALSVLSALSRRLQIDLADEIISNPPVLEFFAKGGVFDGSILKEFATPADAREEIKRFFREHLQADPFRYADRLLNTNATIDVDQTLAYLWDLEVESDKEKLKSNVLNWLRLWHKDPNQTEATQRLMRSLRKSQNFKARLLPEMKIDFESWSQTNKDDEDLEKVRGWLQELEKEEPASTLNYAPQLKFDPITGTFKWPGLPNDFPFHPRKPTRTGEGFGVKVSLLALSIAAFVIASLAYQGETPASASLLIRFASKLIMLVMDAVALLPFVNSIMTVQDNLSLINKAGVTFDPNRPMFGSGGILNWRDLFPQYKAAFLAGVVPLVYVLQLTHSNYIGPLTFKNQVVQFLINLPAIGLAIAAFRYPEK